MMTNAMTAYSVSPMASPAILVVEDEPLIRMALAEFLEDGGFHVIEAGSSAEAVAIVETNPDIRLVFSDVVMPGSMDGIALARWLEENRPGLPVLLTSGYTGNAHIGQAVTGRPFFAKPYSLDAVAQKIREFLTH